MNPARISEPQWGMLCLLSGVGPEEHDAPRGQVVLRAMERRGWAEWRGSRRTPRIERWHATHEGMALLARSTGRTVESFR